MVSSGRIARADGGGVRPASRAAEPGSARPLATPAQLVLRYTPPLAAAPQPARWALRYTLRPTRKGNTVSLHITHSDRNPNSAAPSANTTNTRTNHTSARAISQIPKIQHIESLLRMRERLKGPPVAVRLPLAAYERLEAAAAGRGQTVRAWIEGRLLEMIDLDLEARHLDEQATHGRHPAAHGVGITTSWTGATASEPPPVVSIGCDHRISTVISGGMRKCGACGAIRGMDGVWRR